MTLCCLTIFILKYISRGFRKRLFNSFDLISRKLSPSYKPNAFFICFSRSKGSKIAVNIILLFTLCFGGFCYFFWRFPHVFTQGKIYFPKTFFSRKLSKSWCTFFNYHYVHKHILSISSMYHNCLFFKTGVI